MSAANKFTFKPEYKALWASSRPDFHAPQHRRTGQNWNDAECRHLLAGFQMEGCSIPVLAKRHERGVAGVSAQLARIMEDSPKVLRLYEQLRQNELVPSLASRARAYADALLAGEQLKPCTGPNCGSTDPRFHSLECYAQHDATATPAATPSPQDDWPAHNRRIAEAFAQGTKVEYFSHSKQRWAIYVGYGRRMRAGDPKREWRVYTPPRRATLGATVREVNGSLVLVHSPLSDANLVLEFTDGELTAATVNDGSF